jgi:hypothetical protein
VHQYCRYVGRFSARSSPRFFSTPLVTPCCVYPFHNQYLDQNRTTLCQNTIMSFLNKIGTKIALQRAGLGNLSLPKDNPFAAAPKNGQEGSGEGFANPFTNMQWPPKAFSSWQAPAPQTPVSEPPIIGERARTDPKLSFPTTDGRPVVVMFLRYCGCPCKYYQILAS